MSIFTATRSDLAQAVTDRYSAVDVAVAFGQRQNSKGKDIVKWQLGRTCPPFVLLISNITHIATMAQCRRRRA